MGAAIASHVVADRARIPELRGLFFLNYPFHRPATPEIIGDAHFSKISAPMIFIAGTRDIYAQPKAVKSAVSRLGARARIHWVEGADRNFNKHKGRAIYSKTLEDIVQILVGWINSPI